jgi:hypothetical protein
MIGPDINITETYRLKVIENNTEVTKDFEFIGGVLHTVTNV